MKRFRKAGLLIAALITFVAAPATTFGRDWDHDGYYREGHYRDDAYYRRELRHERHERERLRREEREWRKRHERYEARRRHELDREYRDGYGYRY